MSRPARSKDQSRDVLGAVQRAWGESPFYQARLRGPAPDRFVSAPEDPFTPDKQVADALIRGRLAVGSDDLDCDGDLVEIWDLVKPGAAAHAFMQEFVWLRHLRAVGPDGASAARTLMRGWLDRYEKWSAEAWDPYFVSERLVQLCAHHKLILAGGDALWRSRVLTSAARQTRHLANAAHRAETGLDRLMTALGLCVAGHCLPGCDAPAMRGLEMARRELRLQLRADGGHVSRNPSRQLKLAVRILTAVRAVEARGRPAPGFLKHTMLRAGAMASFFRCSDGRLAIFNGGYEDDPKAVLAIERALDQDNAPTGFARHTGYQRLSTGKTLVIADTGDDVAPQPFKSAGSLHVSSGRCRIIVNCGNGGHRASEWRDAMMRPEAHSALSFDLAAGRAPAPGPVSHRRVEDPKGLLLDIERSLLIAEAVETDWRRRLFLAAGGADLRGEDRLLGFPEKIAAAGVWRFHLHPTVKASLARDKKSALFLLPNKEGWRFKSNASQLSLEKSVYCGRGDAPVATEQIVLRVCALPPRADGQVVAKWALRRLDAA
ncbi:MAG: heparinase II/III family protein [Pseudomonadota bacterium]